MKIVSQSKFHQYRRENEKITEYVRLELFKISIPNTGHHIPHFSFNVFDEKEHADVLEWLESMGVHQIEYTSYEDAPTYSMVYYFSTIVPVQLQVMYNLKFS